MLSNQELLTLGFIGSQANLIPENSPKTPLDGKITPQTWLSTLPAQISAMAQLLTSANTALSMEEIAAQFKGKGAWKKGLPRILETLEALGRARREGGDGLADEGWRGL